MKEEPDSQEISVFLHELAFCIKNVRKEKGYSQDRLALEAGLARGTLSRIEKGLSDPQASTLAKIARTLGVSVSRLFPIP